MADNDLPALLEASSELITGLPEPVRENLFKAIGDLIFASVDVPRAWLEDKAEAIRDRTRGRRIILETAAKNAAQITDQSDIQNRALEYFAGDALRTQANREAIAKGVFEHLGGPRDYSKAKTQAIDEDWLAHFRKTAGEKSNADIQAWFSKILVGEIFKPGSFSLLALNALSLMRRQSAEAFQALSNSSFELPDGTVFCTWKCAIGRSVSLEMVHELQAVGLVGFDGWAGISAQLDAETRASYAGHSVLIKLKKGHQPGRHTVGSLGFLSPGKELRSILNLEPDWDGWPDIDEELKHGHFTIERPEFRSG